MAEEAEEDNEEMEEGVKEEVEDGDEGDRLNFRIRARVYASIAGYNAW